MQNFSTTIKVVNLDEYRLRRKNEQFAEAVLSRWNDKGPAGGQTLFTAILDKAVKGPIATKGRAEILLPVLLEVLDEIEVQEASSDDK